MTHYLKIQIRESDSSVTKFCKFKSVNDNEVVNDAFLGWKRNIHVIDDVIYYNIGYVYQVNSDKDIALIRVPDSNDTRAVWVPADQLIAVPEEKIFTIKPANVYKINKFIEEQNKIGISYQKEHIDKLIASYSEKGEDFADAIESLVLKKQDMQNYWDIGLPMPKKCDMELHLARYSYTFIPTDKGMIVRVTHLVTGNILEILDTK